MGGTRPQPEDSDAEAGPSLAKGGDGATGWVQPAGVLWRRTTTGVALLPPGAEAPLVLTGSAALVWDLLTTSHTLAEATVLLAERHGVEPAVVAADVVPLLDQLARCGALVPPGGAR